MRRIMSCFCQASIVRLSGSGHQPPHARATLPPFERPVHSETCRITRVSHFLEATVGYVTRKRDA